MLKIEIGNKNHIAVLKPHGKPNVQDFKTATNKIDAHIKETGELNGLLIHTQHFLSNQLIVFKYVS